MGNGNYNIYGLAAIITMHCHETYKMCVGIIQNILKRPKLEIFLAEFFFTQSKPVGLDDLGTRKGI
jgi:hypothetical protein